MANLWCLLDIGQHGEDESLERFELSQGIAQSFLIVARWLRIYWARVHLALLAIVGEFDEALLQARFHVSFERVLVE